MLTFKVNTFEAEALPNDDMFGQLKARLKSIPKPADRPSSKPPVLRIECDKSLKYTELMRVIDLCREQGFTDVGILPIPKKGVRAK